MSFKFKPEHFWPHRRQCREYEEQAEAAAEKANTLLDEYLGRLQPASLPLAIGTREYLLWPKEPEECQHKVFKHEISDREQRAICRDCGITLKATWEKME